jgi:hypothetical protein
MKELRTNINTHDFANNFADQNFLPDAVKTHHYMFLATTPEKYTTRDFKKIAGKENTVK